MMPAIPAIGVRFDINCIDSGSYGIECWKIFWEAVDPAALNGSVLYEGDTAASMAGRENVFCIAIQHAEESVLRAAKSALTNDPKFTSVCAPPLFVEGAVCTAEPLVMAGKSAAVRLSATHGTGCPARETVRRDGRRLCKGPCGVCEGHPWDKRPRGRDKIPS